MIRWANFDSRRKIKDDAFISWPCLLPSSLDSFANLYSKVWLGLSECFWAVLILEDGAVLGSALLCQLFNDFGVLDGKLDSLLLRVVEDYLPERGTCGVVHVDNGMFCSCDGIDCAFN